jgi:hypothetical protein
MNRISKLGLVVFGLLGVMTLGACGGHHAYSAKHPERAYKYVSYRVESVLDDLDATEAQRGEVHAVKDRVYDDIKSLRNNTRKAGRTALAEFKKSDPDGKKLHSLVDARMDEMRIKMHKLVDGLMEVHGTLTPEQRGELIAMIEERVGDDAQ